MYFYHKLILFLLILMVFPACKVWNDPEVKVVGPVTYSHQVSKKEIKYEPDWLVPKSSISIARLNYDASTQIVYAKINMYKKYKGEYYLHSISKIDTLNLTGPDSTYIPTDYFLSGNFIRPAGAIPYWQFEDRGIIFWSNGYCVCTSVSNCSDSPCSTTTQTNGRYRTAGDTIYVTQFMTRSLHSGMNYSHDNSVVTINDVAWDVREPFEQIYLLSPTNDTLFNISKSPDPKTAYYLLGSDSLIRLQDR